MSQDPFLILIVLACLAVVVVLMLGLGGFAKGSGWAQKNSNKLMQYRIAAQFVAVLLIVAYVYFRQSGGQ
ncbi:MAG: twin transmembrane helix small protein [Tateyamaria sp.]|uniref:twin transmembrane helix small protein n=1 Tax=unclassified Tateyamaria TaxID=2645127 RepID=UPI000D54B166|nr:twin transmembrane helix small protein [Tateyamaria sp. Alg231-49]